MSSPVIERVPVARLRPNPKNSRIHSKKQIAQIAASITRFGFTNPVLVAADDEIIAGHGRVAAAKLLGLAEVPVVRLDHLSAAERRAYLIADNKLAENSGWDRAALKVELRELSELALEIEVIGFAPGEIVLERDPDGPGPSAKRRRARERVPPSEDSANPVSRTGDTWLLGPHRLACGECGERAGAACDYLVRHFEATAGERAVLAATGQSFAEVARERTREATHAG
jgi:hypothetical protein